MAIQILGIGTVADDGTGDSLRIAGDKINDNFNEIYTAFGDGSTLTGAAITALNNATANELVTVGATTTELDAEANLTFDGTTLAVTGNITVPNDGDIGSVGATDAIQISSAGIVTFKDDILIKDGGTIGVASSTSAITIASTGIVTFVDDIIIKDSRELKLHKESRHTIDMIEKYLVHLEIDHLQMGVGGEDSWVAVLGGG